MNEAWYLATVEKWSMKEGGKHGTVWSSQLAKLSWLLGDVPSRYTVDVWRTVQASIIIMVVFYFIYLLVLQQFPEPSLAWEE